MSDLSDRVLTKQVTGSLKATSLEDSVPSLMGFEWFGMSDCFGMSDLSDRVLLNKRQVA